MRNSQLTYLVVVVGLFMTIIFTGCSGKDAELSDIQIAALPQPKRTGLPKASGGLVISIGEEAITADEIVNPLVRMYSEIASMPKDEFYKTALPGVDRMVTNKIVDIILYNQAKKEAKDNFSDMLDKAVKNEVKRFVSHFGGDYARAEVALKEMGMDWESFQDSQRRMIMSQSYLRESIKTEERAATYTELRQHYDEVKDKMYNVEATLHYSLIDIQVDKIPLSDPNADAKTEAEQLANQIATRAKDGEDFADLAKQYSHGHRATVGGEWKPVRPDSLAEPYNILVKSATGAQSGDIVGPIQANDRYFIMKIIENQPASSVPFEEVQSELAAQLEVKRNREAAEKFNRTLMKQSKVTHRRLFVDYCVNLLYAKVQQVR